MNDILGDLIGALAALVSSVASAMGVVALLVLLSTGVASAWWWVAVPMFGALSIFNGYLAADLANDVLRKAVKR